MANANLGYRIFSYANKKLTNVFVWAFTKLDATRLHFCNTNYRLKKFYKTANLIFCFLCQHSKSFWYKALLRHKLQWCHISNTHTRVHKKGVFYWCINNVKKFGLIYRSSKLFACPSYCYAKLTIYFYRCRQYGTHFLYPKSNGQTELVWMAWSNTQMVCLQTVTYLSINPAQCLLTLLMQRTILPRGWSCHCTSGSEWDEYNELSLSKCHCMLVFSDAAVEDWQEWSCVGLSTATRSQPGELLVFLWPWESHRAMWVFVAVLLHLSLASHFMSVIVSVFCLGLCAIHSCETHFVVMLAGSDKRFLWYSLSFYVIVVLFRFLFLFYLCYCIWWTVKSL